MWLKYVNKLKIKTRQDQESKNVQASGRPESNVQNKSHPNEMSKFSPRLRAATHMRSTALGGFAPTQAGPQQTPLVGVVLIDVETSVAV